MVWEMFLSAAWRIRVGGMSYIAGVVTTGMLGRLERDGMDRNTAEDLAAACEQGFVTAMNEKDEDDGAGKD